MKHIVLDKDFISGNTWAGKELRHLSCCAAEILTAMKRSKNTHRVYKTVFQGHSSKYIFRTTSKNIHLKLGLITDGGLGNLGLLIAETNKKWCCWQFLLSTKIEEAQETFLVSITKDGEDIIYTLSPVH